MIIIDFKDIIGLSIISILLIGLIWIIYFFIWIIISVYFKKKK